MNISSLGIPNIRTTTVGSRRNQIQIVEAVVRLEAWDGYLVKRWEYPTRIWEKPRAIADGTVLLRFACSADSAPEDWDTQVAAYHRLLEEQWDMRDSIRHSPSSRSFAPLPRIASAPPGRRWAWRG